MKERLTWFLDMNWNVRVSPTLALTLHRRSAVSENASRISQAEKETHLGGSKVKPLLAPTMMVWLAAEARRGRAERTAAVIEKRILI